MSDPDDKKREAVQHVLGEPVAAGLSDRAWRVRTQLLVVSVFAISLVGFGLHVNKEATLFGFSLEGLSDQLVRRGLAIWIVYLVIHFAWMAWEGFAEWRLRLTGTKVVAQTVGIFASDDADYPTDPQQSTLANWWRGQAMRIGNLTGMIEKIESRFKELEGTIREACATKDPLNVSNAVHPIVGLQQNAVEVKQSIDAAVKSLGSMRIPVSLERFERAYVRFLKAQNQRWLWLDVLLPLAVAAVALWYLARR